MDVRHLRYFLALAEEQHFGRAAAHAHIEQSALSRNISQLEDDLGVPLFVRSRQGTTLTPAGTALREHARLILTNFERAKRAVAAVGGLPPILHVGLSDGLVQPRLSELFHRWREVEPTVPLQITELPSYAQQDALQTEHIDIALGFGAASDSLAVEPLWHDPVVVVVPHDHVLAQAETLAFSDISECPLVLCHPRVKPGLRAQIDAILQGAGIDPNPMETADSPAGMIVRVGAGRGLGFLDANHAQTVHRPDVVMVPLAEPEAILTTFALTKREREDAMAPAIRRFIALACAMGQASLDAPVADCASQSCPI